MYLPPSEVSRSSSSSALASKSNYIPRLDVLRAVAILGVFLFHIYITWLESSPLNQEVRILQILEYGWMGVPIFFVLSGFVIHLSFLTRPNKFNVKEFYKRRFWRIYPSYLIAVIVLSILSHRNILQILIHVLAIQNFKEEWFYQLNPSFWSLAVEIQFYLLYPIVLIFRKRIGMSKTLLLTLILGLLIRLIAFLSIGKQSLAPTIMHSTFTLWFDWCLGAFVAENYFQKIRTFNSLHYAVFAIVLTFIASINSWHTQLIQITASSIAAAMIIDTYIQFKGKLLLIESLLIPLGLWSYSFYLWHQPILLRTNQILLRFAGFLPSSGLFIANTLISFGITLLLSWLLYTTVETKVKKWRWWSLDQK